ncbi:MAG: hypothetical protein ACOYKC_01030 [Anaerolineaceae bacterium]|jgi:hypothetical protein
MIKLLELSPVLTVFPYALLYYGLLIASAGLALLTSFRSANKSRPLQISLIVILISQLLLLTINLFAYQGLSGMEALLPIWHRGLNLINLIWLIWVIFEIRDNVFPDWAPVLGTVLVFLAAIVLSLWWLPLSKTESFNFSVFDHIWIVITLLLTLLAGIFYYLRFRQGVVEALLILGISVVGFIVYLLLPQAGNLPAVVMMSQMLYYPLLISLANQAGKPNFNLSDPDNGSSQAMTLRTNIAKTFLETSLQSNRGALEKTLSHGLSLYLMADLLGFLSYEDGADQLKLSSTYDLIREDHISKVGLPIAQFASFLEAMNSDLTLLSNRDGQYRAEKEALMPLSGYNRVGNLMLYPLPSTDPASKRAIFALSPYTGKVWGQEELERLEPLKETIGKLLEKAIALEEDARRLNNLREELVEKTQQIQVLNRDYNQSQSKLAQAKDDLAQTQSIWTEEVALWIDRQKKLEHELEQLKNTIEANRENVEQADKLRLQKKQLEETIQENARQADQLREALDQAGAVLNKLSFLANVPTSPLDPIGNEEELNDVSKKESDSLGQ